MALQAKRNSTVGTIVKGGTIMNSNIQVGAQSSHANSSNHVSARVDDVRKKRRQTFEAEYSAHGGHEDKLKLNSPVEGRPEVSNNDNHKPRSKRPRNIKPAEAPDINEDFSRRIEQAKLDETLQPVYCG